MNSYALHYAPISLEHAERVKDCFPDDGMFEFYADGDSFAAWGEKANEHDDPYHGIIVFLAPDVGVAWDIATSVVVVLIENQMIQLYASCHQDRHMPYAITDASDWSIQIEAPKNRSWKQKFLQALAFNARGNA